MFGELIFIMEALEEMLDVHEQIVLASLLCHKYIIYILFYPTFFSFWGFCFLIFTYKVCLYLLILP